MKFIYKYIILSICLSLFYSCTINSNRMLRTPKDYNFDEIETELNNIEYKTNHVIAYIIYILLKLQFEL